jgi:hypothetical protein
MRRLEEWARHRYGNLDVARDAAGHCELAAVRLPELPQSNPGGRE